MSAASSRKRYARRHWDSGGGVVCGEEEQKNRSDQARDWSAGGTWPSEFRIRPPREIVIVIVALAWGMDGPVQSCQSCHCRSPYIQYSISRLREASSAIQSWCMCVAMIRQWSMVVWCIHFYYVQPEKVKDDVDSNFVTLLKIWRLTPCESPHYG